MGFNVISERRSRCAETVPLSTVEELCEPKASRWVSNSLTCLMVCCFLAGGWFAFDALNQREAVASITANSQRTVTRKIEDIQAGDFVLSRNPLTGKQERKRVVETYQRTSYHLRYLTFQDNLGNEQKFQTTDEHPFWSVSRGEFVNAGDLKLGETVTSPDGKLLTLTKTFRKEQPQGIPVFNFQVEDYHTYFVASRGSRAPPVFVHNADCVEFAEDLLKARPDGVIFRMEPDPNKIPYIGDLPGYPVKGQPNGAFLKHDFHLENGVLRDPAFPDGIAVDMWLENYGELNNFRADEILDFIRFTPNLN